MKGLLQVKKYISNLMKHERVKYDNYHMMAKETHMQWHSYFHMILSLPF